MWKVKEYMSGGDEEERAESFLDEESEGICSLSTTQRMYAFAACLLSGLVLMFLALFVFAKPIKFALLFTLGNVLAVGSTAFLMGAEQQLRMMFDPVRVYATAIYIGFVVLALICALWIQSKILTLLAIICEICALIWYCLSYIPFARRIVSDLMIRFCDTEL
ncbi:Vesicle transport protein, Got1/SFT2-like protein [Corchorus capsularis]|uniref:Vesicle transport protein n=1 Tax=Corchorus capsularis TaxID=210143 RepID=A0A1R3J0P8_COCAP|nr:Vesicle transport protein, Got1/SFT2-like protein [Corchorus capsularis]